MPRRPTHSPRALQVTRRRSLAFVLALLFVPAVHACTLCHTADAREIRHQVLGHGFGENLSSILMVFPVLLGAIHLAGRERPAGHSGDDHELQ